MITSATITATHRLARGWTTMLAITLLAVTGCQSMPASHLAPAPIQHATSGFFVTGKIGITVQTATGKQGGSAFYAWSQTNERFGIELVGALGLGTTNILYDGATATLTSNQTGTITAPTPEELLSKATGWQVPISQLPYWIMGQQAPTDTDSHFQSQRLMASSNAQWQAVFSYDNSPLPKRINITHHDGHRIVMTITHHDNRP